MYIVQNNYGIQAPSPALSALLVPVSPQEASSDSKAAKSRPHNRLARSVHGNLGSPTSAMPPWLAWRATSALSATMRRHFCACGALEGTKRRLALFLAGRPGPEPRPTVRFLREVAAEARRARRRIAGLRPANDGSQMAPRGCIPSWLGPTESEKNPGVRRGVAERIMKSKR